MRREAAWTVETGRLDGRTRQAVNITTLFGDSVVGIHHLDREACGRVRPTTRALFGLASALLVGGLVAVILSSLGAGAGLLLLGTAVGVFALTRAGRERRVPHFLVGEGREAQLPVPGALLPAPCYPLVLSTPGGYHLLFGCGMQGGVEEQNGVEISLEELVRTGQAWPASGLPARAVAVPSHGRAWVRIGETTVVIDSVETSASLKAPLLGSLDSPGLVSNVCSFGAHAVVLALVFAVPPSSATLSLDSFNVDSMRVRYRINAPDQIDREVPKWLRQAKRDEQPAAGASTKGERGKVGNPKARRLHGRVAVTGNSRDLEAAKDWARQAARTSGLLIGLGGRRGGPLAHIFSDRDTALGPDAVDAMGTLIANVVGENDGTGGLTTSGAGRFGGGTAVGLIVAGPGYDTIGPRRAGGSKYRWSGPPLKRDGKGEVVPDRAKGMVIEKGALDKELVRREIRRHLNEIRFCYSKELQTNPDLRGRVVVNFTIAGTGKVVSSQIQQTTLGDTRVESCITQAFFRWTFPKPAGQGMVIVSYPFVFHATE